MTLSMESKPKFFEGLFVRSNWKSEVQFIGEIIEQKYRTFAEYTGWMCKIQLEDNSNIWIRESWIEPAPPTREEDCKRYAIFMCNEEGWLDVPITDEWLELREFLVRESVPETRTHSGKTNYFVLLHLRKWIQELHP
jgi:hypothetical protein